MLVLRLGGMGPEIKVIQQKLRDLDHYSGPIDGIFGGGTTVAVKAFQRQAGIGIDGVVGPTTWGKLFNGEQTPATPQIAASELAHRCLALTGSFETSAPPPECFCGLSGILTIRA